MGDFNLEEVLFFIISKGGRVRNHELVTHFRNFLNHPVNKSQNREKFKDYVNELATIKIDEGEKVLVLKRKYRPGSETNNSPLSEPPSFPHLRGQPKATNSWKKSVVSEPDLSDTQSSSTSEVSLTQSTQSSSTSEASLAHSTVSLSVSEASLTRSQNESLRAHSEPPAAKGTEMELDGTNGLSMSRVRSDEAVEVRARSSDQMTLSAEVDSSMNNINGSNNSLTSKGSQRSQTSDKHSAVSAEEDTNASVVSVKDKIKKLNKSISDSDMGQPRSVGSNLSNKKSHKQGHIGEDDDSSYSSGTFVTLDSEQREWMVVCSYCDYHEMNRLLSKNPSLAKLQDFTNGYTALHWAAKKGKAEVIKLVANKPGVYVDQRSHGGYTALHLAAIHGQDQIIELLVQAYKADANLRDYSGKKAKQYLKNSASSKTQQLLVSRRIGADSVSIKVLDDAFLRTASTRMSNRAKAMSTLLQVKSVVTRQPVLRSSWNGSTNGAYDEKDRKTSPESTNSSPGSARKKTSHGSHLMPPPLEPAPKKGHHYSRHRPTSRDPSPSLSSSHKNGDIQGLTRTGSDPGMLET